MEDQVEAAAVTSPPPPFLSATSRREGLLRNRSSDPLAKDRSLGDNKSKVRPASDHSSTSRGRRAVTPASGPLGDSMLSLDLDFMEDAVLPPPELTRPEPRHHHAPARRASISGGAANSGNQGYHHLRHQQQPSSPPCWKQGGSIAPAAQAPPGRPRPSSLESIMQEQRRQQQEQEGEAAARPGDDDDKSVYLEEISRAIIGSTTGEEGDAEAVEEALVKLALERSLRSVHADQRGGGGGTSGFHGSMRSLSSDFAREVQMEADRTEQDLDDAPPRPHTPRGASSSSSSSRRPAASRSSSGPRTPQPRRPATPSGGGASSSASPCGHGSRSPQDGNPRSASAPRRGVRRTQSLELEAAPALAVPSPGGGGGGGGGGSAAPNRACVRQASIRIGPLPKGALVEDGTLVDGAEAVLEVARKNLSASEVEIIERALRKGKPLSVVETADGTAKRSGRRHHHHHHSRSSGAPASPHTASTALTGDSRHSTSDGSASITSDELDGGASRHLPIEASSDHLSYRSPARASSSAHSRSAASPGPASPSFGSSPTARLEYDLRGAEENLSEDELRQIQRALLETGEEGAEAAPGGAKISQAEAAAIQRAIREAEEEEEMRSFRLAMQMQQEEDERLQSQRPRHQQGNVRTMTRAEFEAESRPRVGAFQAAGRPIEHHPLDHQQQHDASSPGGGVAAGFRMNSNLDRHEWTRRDQNSVVGPNREVRTKHDASLAGQANAHRLGLDEEEMGGAAAPRVGNTAYNAFMQSVQRGNRKGVAAHGTGRAGGSDADATKGGAMDGNVRLLISRAINSGLIERCNGVVKEGKEAILYHADRGEESGGFDVAVKVFKRIQDFKGRGDYVDGDPRYFRESFRRLSGREQLELWTEKEFRNLTRASRAGVPVPSPLYHKENVLFMRFLGTEGWPAPQLREIDLRHGSKKWGVLYTQVMEAVRKLYCGGRLVHGDLSEYNILVAPASLLVETDSARVVIEDASDRQDLQAVLIDFGQAVDTRHPDAVILLQHDLDRVKSFFARQGVETMGSVEALAYVVEEDG